MLEIIVNFFFTFYFCCVYIVNYIVFGDFLCLLPFFNICTFWGGMFLFKNYISHADENQIVLFFLFLWIQFFGNLKVQIRAVVSVKYLLECQFQWIKHGLNIRLASVSFLILFSPFLRYLHASHSLPLSQFFPSICKKRPASSCSVVKNLSNKLLTGHWIRDRSKENRGDGFKYALRH